jgi:hypothetical protein
MIGLAPGGEQLLTLLATGEWAGQHGSRFQLINLLLGSSQFLHHSLSAEFAAVNRQGAFALPSH